MAYTVFRSDLMTGTADPAALASCRVYNGSGAAIAVENGVIVELQGYDDKNTTEKEREVVKAVYATSSTAKAKCAIIASVEIMYDERKHDLAEYINEAGKICRAYIPRSMNVYSITADGFDGTAPTVGQSVGIGANGKLKAGQTGWGACVAIETVGTKTYYAIRVD